jgi:hypothetical protein
VSAGAQPSRPRLSEVVVKRSGLAVVGVVLVIMGSVFTLQGLGYLPGSAMTGVTLWAVLGPVIAVVGIVMIVRAVRTGRPGRRT